MRSILVTGGAGFIGSHMVDHLLANHPDYRVIVLDKLTYAGRKSNLDQARASASNRMELVEADIENLETNRELVRQCDAVIHLAAESHVVRSTENPLLFFGNNILGTAKLLEAARLENVQRFLMDSSVEVYGSCRHDWRAWHEDEVPFPPTPYASSKLSGELVAYSYWVSFGLPVVITRSCNNYGPRQHEEKQLPAFISAALRNERLPVQGDGKHKRQWLYVTDHCRALDMLLHAPAEQVVGETFNIGAGPAAERTTLENAKAVLKLIPESQSEVEYRPDRQPSIRRLALDSRKLEQRLGWEPLKTFEDGLKETVMYYREVGSNRPLAATIQN